MVQNNSDGQGKMNKTGRQEWRGEGGGTNKERSGYIAPVLERIRYQVASSVAIITTRQK